MPRPPRFRRLAGGPLPGALLLSLVALAGAEERLVPAAFNAQTDTLGFLWDVNPVGMIGDGSNDCFDGGMLLRIDNWQFQPTQRQEMTRDGRTFVLVGRQGDLEVTRRVTVDRNASAVRFVETIRNTGSKRLKAQVTLYSNLGGNAMATGTNRRAAFVGTAFDRREAVLYALQQNQGGRPSVFWALCSPRSRNAPGISVNGHRAYMFSWAIDVAPGRRVSIATTAGQRRWPRPPSEKELERDTKQFIRSPWFEDLPIEVRSSIINFEAGSGATDDDRPLKELEDLATFLEVERGGAARLVLGDTEPLEGGVEGGTIEVSTRLGTTRVPLEEVAALRGGAGRGRTMRCYLRNGEVLVGTLAASDLVFKPATGLEMELGTRALDTLFLALDPRDGLPSPGMRAYVTLLDGTRLGLENARSAALDATTPWGRLTVPGEELKSLQHITDPVPGLWATLADGTRFPFLPGGETMVLQSLRFGPVSVPAAHLVSWSRAPEPTPAAAGASGGAPTPPQPESSPTEATPPADVAPGEAPPPPPGTDKPHARMRGDALLPGGPEGADLKLLTSAGDATLRHDAVLALRALPDEGPGVFEVLFRDGGARIVARLAEPVLSWATPYGALRLGARDLEAIVLDPAGLRRLEEERRRAEEEADAREAAERDAAAGEGEEVVEDEEIDPSVPAPPAPAGGRRRNP